jgi:hypothetical protein
MDRNLLLSDWVYSTRRACRGRQATDLGSRCFYCFAGKLSSQRCLILPQKFWAGDGFAGETTAGELAVRSLFLAVFLHQKASTPEGSALGTLS